MKDFKVDIREIIWELNNEILLVKSYRDRYKEEIEDDNTFYVDETEAEVEFNRYDAEIDTLNRIRNDYMKRNNLTEDDIKKYLDEEDESYPIEEEVNPVNTTCEVESITYTIK